MTVSLKNKGFICALSAMALLATIPEAAAGDRIGVAATVRNRVSGRIQSQVQQLNSGENVFDREQVKTETDSSAKIVLKDSANINVGPNSAVTLDNFVYSGDEDLKKASVNLAKGAFRFTTGSSDKKAYQIKTPTATIGVRG
jgi:hypothetical protein